jgi:hypothetical protein
MIADRVIQVKGEPARHGGTKALRHKGEMPR